MSNKLSEKYQRIVNEYDFFKSLSEKYSENYELYKVVKKMIHNKDFNQSYVTWFEKSPSSIITHPFSE